MGFTNTILLLIDMQLYKWQLKNTIIIILCEENVEQAVYYNVCGSNKLSGKWMSFGVMPPSAYITQAM